MSEVNSRRILLHNNFVVFVALFIKAQTIS